MSHKHHQHNHKHSNKHIKGHLDVDHHLKVKGHLNFGQNVISQLTSNLTTVNINSSSGCINMFEVMPTGAIAFNVTNDKVHSKSVVLLTVLGDVPKVNAWIISVGSGTFRICVLNTSNVPQTNIASIFFLVC